MADGRKASFVRTGRRLGTSNAAVGNAAERIVASWAERHSVHQVVCKPDWHRHGRAAPFRPVSTVTLILTAKTGSIPQ